MKPAHITTNKYNKNDEPPFVMRIRVLCCLFPLIAIWFVYADVYVFNKLMYMVTIR